MLLGQGGSVLNEKKSLNERENWQISLVLFVNVISSKKNRIKNRDEISVNNSYDINAFLCICLFHAKAKSKCRR